MLALNSPAHSQQSAGVFLGNDPNSVELRNAGNRSGNTPRLLSDLQKLLSWPMRKTGSFSFLKVFIISWCMRTVHSILTAADLNDLSAGSVFAPARAGTCRLFSRISTLFKLKVLHSHFADMATAAIGDKMVFID